MREVNIYPLVDQISGFRLQGGGSSTLRVMLVDTSMYGREVREGGVLRNLSCILVPVVCGKRVNMDSLAEHVIKIKKHIQDGG